MMLFRVKKGETHALNKRPGFKQWVNYVAMDLNVLGILALIAMTLYYTDEKRVRSDDRKSEYLEKLETVEKLLPVVTCAIPILVILASQLLVRSFWDTNNAIFGVLHSVTGAWAFVKILHRSIYPITRLFAKAADERLHNQNPFLPSWLKYKPQLKKFPGTFGTLCFAGFVFLSLYLNGKLKVFSNYRTSIWKLVALWVPLLAAFLVACVEATDGEHMPFDPVIGALIGTMFALASYRMGYASLFDYRCNHIPLSPQIPYSSTANEFQTAFRDATLSPTRKWTCNHEKPRFQSIWTMNGLPQCERCVAEHEGDQHRHAGNEKAVRFASPPYPSNGHERASQKPRSQSIGTMNSMNSQCAMCAEHGGGPNRHDGSSDGYERVARVVRFARLPPIGIGKVS